MPPTQVTGSVQHSSRTRTSLTVRSFHANKTNYKLSRFRRGADCSGERPKVLVEVERKSSSCSIFRLALAAEQTRFSAGRSEARERR